MTSSAWQRFGGCLASLVLTATASAQVTAAEPQDRPDAKAMARPLAEPVTIVLADGAIWRWRGISKDEGPGGTTSMLYPAPGVGGLLAAIATHAVAVKGVRESERTARQVEADKVLERHAAVIDAWPPERLLSAALQRWPAEGRPAVARSAAESSRGWVAQMTPSLGMAMDQRTLVLDNALTLQPAGSAAGTAPVSLVVRVVSSPVETDDPATVWTADDGKRLVEQAAAMLAHSIELALTPAWRQPLTSAARSQRYAFGLEERVERGQPVAESCARVVVRTLREGLLSVPLTASARQTAGRGSDCRDDYRLPTETR